jgi:hypothetical protein
VNHGSSPNREKYAIVLLGIDFGFPSENDEQLVLLPEAPQPIANHLQDGAAKRAGRKGGTGF